MHFFHKQKQKFEVKNFKSFFGGKLAFGLKYKFTIKKICMQNLTFCVYNVVEDEFFIQKIQNLQKSVFYCKHEYYLLFHLLK